MTKEEPIVLTSEDIDKLYKLSETTDIKDIKKRVAESLAQDRHHLLRSQPFIGSIAMRLNIIPTRDARLRTASTDGNNIYYDIAFYASLNDAERQFVLAHEVWHVVYMHLVRRQNRDHDLFNIASDCEINYMLKKSGFNGPADLCYPDKQVEGKSAEEIYEYLLKKAKRNKNLSNSNDRHDSSGSGSFSNLSDSTQSKNSSDSNKSSALSNCSGNKDGKLSGQFDQHNYTADGKRNEFGKDGKTGITDKWGDVGFDKDYNPSIEKGCVDKIREMVVSAVQEYERTLGHAPIGMEKYLDTILKPEISWKEILAQFVTQCYGGESTWRRFSRRHLHEKIYLPGHLDHKLNACVIVDTSGSCTNDLPKFFGEFNSLIESFGKYDVHMIQCDADVQEDYHYDDIEPFDYTNKDFKVSGFGGSNFIPAFEYIRKRGYTPDVCICLTDGYIDFPKYRLPFPTLVILTSDGNEKCCDWAHITKFKNTGV